MAKFGKYLWVSHVNSVVKSWRRWFSVGMSEELGL